MVEDQNDHAAMHVPTHNYPKGDSFKFGRGYEFSAAPQEPVQRRIVLHFKGVQWFFNATGEVDASIEPQMNALALDAFYRRHYTWKAFTYPHPVFGPMKVKFAADAPFEMPKAIEGGSGFTEEFELVLVEQG